MTDAATRTARDARLAWILGGSLLIAYAVLMLAASTLPLIVYVPGLASAIDLIWAGALFVFALGIRRSGSVVSRRPLGVVALVVAAVVPFVSTVAGLLIPWESIDQALGLIIGQTFTLASFAALLVATVVIGRAGAVPYRVRWVPLIVFVVATDVQVVILLVTSAAASSGDSALAALASVTSLTSWLAVLVLGVLAVFLAPREGVAHRADRVVQIYPPL